MPDEQPHNDAEEAGSVPESSRPLAGQFFVSPLLESGANLTDPLSDWASFAWLGESQGEVELLLPVDDSGESGFLCGLAEPGDRLFHIDPITLVGGRWSRDINRDVPWVFPSEGSVVPEPASGQPELTPVSIEDAIDRAIADLCPCGAQPSAQHYPYCSYHCVPNHVRHPAANALWESHADTMRWRPDLVSAADDSDLVLVERQNRLGFRAEVFERTGTDRLHLRINDGHRFVGTDVEIGEPATLQERCEQAWEKLIRELTSLESIMTSSTSRTRPILAHRSSITGCDCDLCTGRRPRLNGDGDPFWGEMLHMIQTLGSGLRTSRADQWERLLPQGRAVDIRPRGLLESMAEQASRLAQESRRRQTPPAAADEQASETAQERALRLRRQRNTGPARPMDRPRRIDPHTGC